MEIAYHLQQPGVLLIALVCLILGFILKSLFAKKGPNNDSELDSLKQNVSSLTKDNDRAQKSLVKSQGEVENWKKKYNESKNKVVSEKGDDRSQIKMLKEEIAKGKKEVEQAQAEKHKGATKYDRLRNEFESYKRKMNSEKEAIKRYKTELEAFKKSDKAKTDEIAKLSKQVNDMKGSLEKQFQNMSEINEIKSLNRRLKAKNVKLQTDLEYWEKKHFEAHHQLAALKKASSES